MSKICVFAGTTEGRRLAEYLAGCGADVTACVATEYGKALIEERPNLTVLEGRMNEEKIESMLRENAFDMVVDATHPYAAEVTKNVVAACEAAGIEYLRLQRDESLGEGMNAGAEDIVIVPDVEAAAELLDKTEGNILLTTGSKELAKFSNINGFCDRVFARVLPMQESISLCEKAGLSPSHIIAMQGPFSVEMNVAQIDAVSAKWLVSKDGGSAGGFSEKVSAAINSGVKLLVIGRPEKAEGKSYDEVVDILSKKFGISDKKDGENINCDGKAGNAGGKDDTTSGNRKISIVGMGPGSLDYMLSAAIDEISATDCLIGAERIVTAAKSLPLEGKVPEGRMRCFYEISAEKILAVINDNPQFSRFCILMSGDTGFYSGTKKLLQLMGIGGECACKYKDYSVNVIPGISSFSYMCSRLGISYEDVVLASLHGRECNLADAVRQNEKVFVLSAGSDGIVKIGKRLEAAGLGDVTVYVGERLSYDDEKIVSGSAAEFAKCSDGDFDSLSVALIINENSKKARVHGLPDEAFLRNMGEDGEKVVPMTKMEVRAVSLSKLGINADSICYDVGAGTGSVSIEMARIATRGHVYAIECKKNAAELLRKNMAAFGAENMTVVEGFAPDAMEGLPAPTHVFIGGSTGNARDIVASVLKKNPGAVIVATAIALESVSEWIKVMEDFGFENTEIVSMTVARGKKAGNYHLMSGQNPIYIFTMGNN
jgi:precorrin-6Y C5,15-methyltransferase (decarboxylating)